MRSMITLMAVALARKGNHTCHFSFLTCHFEKFFTSYLSLVVNPMRSISNEAHMNGPTPLASLSRMGSLM